MYGSDELIWQLYISREVERVVRVAQPHPSPLIQEREFWHSGGLMIGWCRLPPCYSAFLQVYDFAAGSFFYIGCNVAETAPVAAVEEGYNFSKVKCHEAMLEIGR